MIDVAVDWGDLNPHHSGDVTRNFPFFLPGKQSLPKLGMEAVLEGRARFEANPKNQIYA